MVGLWCCVAGCAATPAAPPAAEPDATDALAQVPQPARQSGPQSIQESAAVPPPVAVVVPPAVVHLAQGIEVDRARGEVRVPASIAVTQGWLEQVVCLTGTRDHEALMTVDCKPSDVHAALLLLGLDAGAPGRWQYNEGLVRTNPPTGPPLSILVRFTAQDETREINVLDWIRGADGRRFPGTWVFAGSQLAKNPKSLGPGEHYVADFTGSLIGLVTFGDETIAATAVISDQIEMESANWEAWTDRMPPEGTAVTLVIVRAHE